MDQRKHVRYLVEYSAAFSGDHISAQGLILDLSPLGCKARSTVLVHKGDFMGLLIDVPRYATPLQIALAVVRWAREQEFGLEFIRIEPKDQERLRQLMRETAMKHNELPKSV